MPPDSIRLSKKAKDQLIALKRRTKIENWNTLCRWALCTSLADKSVPPASKIPADSNVEMTWKTFGGEFSDIYWALIVHRCHTDRLGTDAQTLTTQFRLHLHRGISYMAADRAIDSVRGLASRVL